MEPNIRHILDDEYLTKCRQMYERQESVFVNHWHSHCGLFRRFYATLALSTNELSAIRTPNQKLGMERIQELADALSSDYMSAIEKLFGYDLSFASAAYYHVQAMLYALGPPRPEFKQATTNEFIENMKLYRAASADGYRLFWGLNAVQGLAWFCTDFESSLSSLGKDERKDAEQRVDHILRDVGSSSGTIDEPSVVHPWSRIVECVLRSPKQNAAHGNNTESGRRRRIYQTIEVRLVEMALAAAVLNECLSLPKSDVSQEEWVSLVVGRVRHESPGISKLRRDIRRFLNQKLNEEDGFVDRLQGPEDLVLIFDRVIAGPFGGDGAAAQDCEQLFDADTLVQAHRNLGPIAQLEMYPDRYEG